MAGNARVYTVAGSDHCSVTDPAGVTTNAAWSMGGWVYVTSYGTGGRGFMAAGNFPGSPARGVQLGVLSSGVLSCRLATAQSSDGVTAIGTGAWVRVGATRGGSGISHLKVILNGVEDHDENTDPPAEITAGDSFFTSFPNGLTGQSYLDGKMAWSFWLQGITLTAAQMDAYLNDPQSLVNDYGPDGNITPNALKIFWAQQCSGTTETDQSGTGNTGTYSGTTLSVGGGPTPTTDWNPCLPSARAKGRATVVVSATRLRNRTIGTANGTSTASATLTKVSTLATPFFQAAGTQVNGTGTVTPAWPTHQTGDIGILIVETANEAVSLTTPAGFVEIANSPQGVGTTAGAGAATRLAVYWCRATSNAMSSPLVGDAGDHTHAQIVTFRSANRLLAPFSITAGDTLAGASTTFTIPGATTTVDQCLIIAIVANQTDTTTSQYSTGLANSDLGSLTSQATASSNTTAGNGGGWSLFTGTKSVAGAYGSTTGTLLTSSAQARISIALMPGLLVIAAGRATTSANLTLLGGGSLRNATAAAAGAATVSATISALRAVQTAAAGTSTAAAACGAKRNAIANAAGTSTASVSLGVRRACTALAAGTSTATVTPSRSKQMTATAAGASTATVALGVLRAITVVCAGTSTAVVSIGAKRACTATANGTSTATCTPSVGKQANATANGSSTASATLNVKRAVTVVAAGTSTAAVTAGRIRAASCSAAGTSSASVSIGVRRACVAIANGSSTASCSASAGSARTASAAGTSSASVTIGRIRASSIAAAGTSTASVAMGVRRACVAVATGTSSATCAASAGTKRSAAAAGTSTASAAIGAIRAVVVSAAGSSTATVARGALRAATLACAGTSTASATLGVKRAAAATAAGTSTASVACGVRRACTATANGSSTVTCAGTTGTRRSTAAAGVATASAAIGARRAVTVVAGGTSTATAGANRLRNASASAAGFATVIVSRGARHTIFVQADGIATGAAAMRALRGLVVAAAGSSAAVITPNVFYGSPVAHADGRSSAHAMLELYQAEPPYVGKYKPQHDSGYALLGDAVDFSRQHASGLNILAEKGR